MNSALVLADDLVGLTSDRISCPGQIRVCREQQRNGSWLQMPRRTDHRKTVSRAGHMQVGQHNVKWFCREPAQSLGRARGSRNTVSRCL
jgi:hypothetical protein